MAISSGVVAIKRWQIKPYERNFVAPESITSMYLRNVGLSDVKFRIEGQGKDNYFVVKAGETLPSMNIEGGKTLIFSSSCIDGILEIIFWG